jgi:hypothetical protein
MKTTNLEFNSLNRPLSLQSLTLLATAAATSLSSCATFDTAAVADYNGDGIIADAEYKQYGKQHGVVRTNIETEAMRRDNVVDTVWDVSSVVHGTRSIIGGLSNFGR